ncbi:MAG: hypothetical protein IK078_05125, partial [Lachnospiraceae bacterium]|nr:hypothetical protein [Lachnospiraceae bacterium]
MKKIQLKTYALSMCFLFTVFAGGCANITAPATSADTDGQNVSDQTGSEASDSPQENTAEETNLFSEFCKDGISDEEALPMIITGGIQKADILSHNVEEVTSCEFGDQYIALDTVNVTYIPADLTGLLPQTVTKDYGFYFNGDTRVWELLTDVTTACDVDTAALPGSSWHCNNIDPADLSAIFGTTEPGNVYLHFLNRLGLFSFNMSNEKNTSDERFFTTVSTGGKLILTGDSPIEKSFSVKNGSVTDDGIMKMEVEAEGTVVTLCFGSDVVPASEIEYDLAMGMELDESKVYIEVLPRFGLTSESITEEEWQTQIGMKEENRSPQLSWEPVEGAAKYAVLMIDETTANKWLHWYVITDQTHLDEGAYTDAEAGYAGPYPPETHEYDVYVVALEGDPDTIST